MIQFSLKMKNKIKKMRFINYHYQFIKIKDRIKEESVLIKQVLEINKVIEYLVRNIAYFFNLRASFYQVIQQKRKKLQNFLYKENQLKITFIPHNI